MNHCLAVVALFSVFNFCVCTQKGSLGKYSISDVTVSGVSSGGYMAVQVHVAFSSVVNGSAIFAAGPYYCAEGSIAVALAECMDIVGAGPNTRTFIDLTYTDATLNLIDHPGNMKDDRVYLFSGDGDTVVMTEVVQSLGTYYKAFVDSVVADYSVKAEHCLPTLNYGEPCGTLSDPYIGKCDFDGAGTAFGVLYDDLSSKGEAVADNLMGFDQTPYFSGLMTSLSDVGYVYVPTACADGASCRLHIAFHGCEQTIEDIGSQYAEDTGFNSWAESNNIIVLYPNAVRSEVAPYNPNGCWDWWGYTGVNYGWREGSQMSFVKNMIDALSK